MVKARRTVGLELAQTVFHSAARDKGARVGGLQPCV